MRARKPAFATGVPPDICAFHRYTGSSTLPYHTQGRQFGVVPRVEPPDWTPRLTARLRALYAQ